MTCNCCFAAGVLVSAMVNFNTEREGVKKCPYSCYMKWQKLSDRNKNWEGKKKRLLSNPLFFSQDNLYLNS